MRQEGRPAILKQRALDDSNHHFNTPCQDGRTSLGCRCLHLITQHISLKFQDMGPSLIFLRFQCSSQSYKLDGLSIQGLRTSFSLTKKVINVSDTYKNLLLHQSNTSNDNTLSSLRKGKLQITASVHQYLSHSHTSILHKLFVFFMMN